MLLLILLYPFLFFFFNDTATTEIYTLSLHDALPIFGVNSLQTQRRWNIVQQRKHEHASTEAQKSGSEAANGAECGQRSEEHTSELQSLAYLVCRLLLEKKKKKKKIT